MSFQDYQQSIKWMARNSSKNNLMTGKVFIKRDNGKYDCVILGDQNVKMDNLEPASPNETYDIGDEVFIGLPWGSLSILRILMRSNTSIPAEQIFTFRTKPAVSTGTIYLCCPDETKIKVYSLNGTVGTDITPNSTNLSYIVYYDGYLYLSSAYAYVLEKDKIDGSENINIISQSMYYSAVGLAINTDASMLFTSNGANIVTTMYPDGKIIGYDEFGDPIYIYVEEKELTETSFDVISDVCGDGINRQLYVLGYTGSGNSRIAIFDSIDISWLTEIYTSDRYDKICSDGTLLYLSNSSKVDVYAMAGSLSLTVSESDIQCVAVNIGNIYIITTDKVKKYNSSGVFQSEFDIIGTITDSIII